jgi:hypothetical protein
MVKAKLLVAFFVICCVSLFIGEFYVFSIQSFEEHYPSVLYNIDPQDDPEDLKTMVLETSTANKLPVFLIKRTTDGASSLTIKLYANADAEKILKQDWDIEAGTKRSFFTGTITFAVADIDEAPAALFKDVCYPTDKDTVISSMSEGITSYSSEYLRFPIPDNTTTILVALWGISVAILLLLTYYDTLYSRKEWNVRLVLGADEYRQLFRKVIVDISIYTGAGVIAFLLMGLFSQNTFRWGISVLCFCGFLMLNSIVLVISFGILGKNRKLIISPASSINALKVSLGIKWIVAAIAVIVISLGVAATIEAFKLYIQKSDYERSGTQAYVWMTYSSEFYNKMEPVNTTQDNELFTEEQVVDNFLRYSYKYLNSSIVTYGGDTIPRFVSWGDRFVTANVCGIESNKQQFPYWDTMVNDPGNYLLVPESSNMEKVLSDIERIGYTDLLDIDHAYSYEGNVDLLAGGLHPQFETIYPYKVSNPIILLDTHNYGIYPMYSPSWGVVQTSEQYGAIGIGFAALYHLQFAKMTNEEKLIRAFADQVFAADGFSIDMVDFTITDAYEKYEDLLAMVSRVALIALILSLALLLLELQVSAIVIRLKHETDAQEMIIKKVMGFSVYERFKGLFKAGILIYSIIFVSSAFVAALLHINTLFIVMVVCALMCAIDLVALTFIILRNEKRQVQKILKGGL